MKKEGKGVIMIIGFDIDGTITNFEKLILGDLCSCLPARVKPENKEKMAIVMGSLGGHLTPSQKKVLNYIVERVQ